MRERNFLKIWFVLFVGGGWFAEMIIITNVAAHSRAAQKRTCWRRFSLLLNRSNKMNRSTEWEKDTNVFANYFWGGGRALISYWNLFVVLKWEMSLSSGDSVERVLEDPVLCRLVILFCFHLELERKKNRRKCWWRSTNETCNGLATSRFQQHPFVFFPHIQQSKYIKKVNNIKPFEICLGSSSVLYNISWLI